MQHIEALLRKEIGLDAASIGSSLIERTVRLRMKQHGLKRFFDYGKLLQESRTELNQLIEAVVVTETWFFRDREPFTVFGQIARNEWLPRHPGGIMRILSVPCSSGEEPYSLAMALLDAGVAPQKFQIDAVDISENALARARGAIYGRNSFRGTNLEFRDKHFIPVKEGFALNISVRQQVNFFQANVLDEGFLADSVPYDFIFCRNLLIYFDRATQVLALAKLNRLLTTDGYLFVGPAEVPLVSENGFVSARIPQAFACRKSIHGVSPIHVSSGNHSPTSGSPSLRVNGATVSGAADLARKATIANTSRHSELLQRARQCADSGQLAEAAALCQAHLTQQSDSAEAYYLLGLVKDATNHPEAIDFYRKALYLDPKHYETLIHAALWLEKHGDTAGARTLKRRAERVAGNQRL